MKVTRCDGCLKTYVSEGGEFNYHDKKTEKIEHYDLCPDCVFLVLNKILNDIRFKAMQPSANVVSPKPYPPNFHKKTIADEEDENVAVEE